MLAALALEPTPGSKKRLTACDHVVTPMPATSNPQLWTTTVGGADNQAILPASSVARNE